MATAIFIITSSRQSSGMDLVKRQNAKVQPHAVAATTLPMRRVLAPHGGCNATCGSRDPRKPAVRAHCNAAVGRDGDQYTCLRSRENNR